MQHAQVKHDGETHSVPLKNIELPSGHKMLAPGEVPEGLFDQEDLDEKIEKRLERQKKKLQEDMPGEDDVVLTGEEAERYAALEGTDDADPLEALQASEEQAKASLADAERNESLREFADKTGKSYDALKAHANGETFEVRTEEDEDGNEVQRAYVTPTSEGGEEAEAVPLEEYEPFKYVNLTPESENGDSETEGGNKKPSVQPQRPGGNPPSNEKSDEDIQAEQRQRHSFSM